MQSTFVVASHVRLSPAEAFREPESSKPLSVNIVAVADEMVKTLGANVAELERARQPAGEGCCFEYGDFVSILD